MGINVARSGYFHVRAVFRAFLEIVAITSLATSFCAAQANYATLHSFLGSPDGATPYGGVIIGERGILYGTTLRGGASDLGAVFELAVSGGSWTSIVLHSFSGGDGAYPNANLALGSSQTLYGTTRGGGSGAGTVFELAPPGTSGQWAEDVLYGFEAGDHSGNHSPWGAVLVEPSGTIYTTTFTGTAVSVKPPSASGGSWTGSVIASLTGGSEAGLVSQGGSLFATSYDGGDDDCQAGECAGAVLQLTPPATDGGSWTATTIHNFGSIPEDGNGPMAPLTVGAGGVLYGTTLDGGTGVLCEYPPFLDSGCGTVFQLTPPTTPGGQWTETVLHNFSPQDGDGVFPYSAVILGENGVLYGTTAYGGSGGSTSCSFYGATGCGIVFQLAPPTTPGGTWTETILHSFTSQDGDGAVPMAGLALSSGNKLYGTTSKGGTAGLRTVFVVGLN
jgi:uncharacterized repeat protein (TIGR03803 family)